MERALIKESPLLVHPKLAAKIGLKEAIILQQIHYWLDSKRNNHFYEDHYWVHNTYEEWQWQFPFWASRTIQRAIFRLENLGLLISHVSREFKKTKFYTINYERLDNLSDIPKNTNKTIHISPSRQDDQILKATCPDPGQSIQTAEPSHLPQEQTLPDKSPSRHSVQKEETTCLRSRQGGTIHHDKVARFYIPYTETTTETTLLPPLTPPSSGNLCLRQEQEEDLKKMLKVWDETVYQVLNPGKRLHLTDQRKKLMLQLLNELFDGKMEDWEAYCKSIAECPFLMGQNPKKFRATLDWALSSSNALKVLENDFFSEPVEVPALNERPWDEYEPVLREELKDWPYRDQWLLISEALVKHLGQVTFNVWFRQLKPKEISSKEVVLSAPNIFLKDYVLQEYGPALTTCTKAIYPHNQSISIDVDPNIVMKEGSFFRSFHPSSTEGDSNE